MTRRRKDHNHLLVLAESDDLDEARDVLARVLTNDRADIPAVTQRRNLAQPQLAPRTETADERLAKARSSLAAAKREGEPYVQAVRDAELAVDAVSSRVDRGRTAVRPATPWRRANLAAELRDASAELATASALLDETTLKREPHIARITLAEDELHEAERRQSAERLRERLNRLEVRGPSHDRGIAPPGR